jgi:hypothetical protein
MIAIVIATTSSSFNGRRITFPSSGCLHDGSGRCDPHDVTVKWR